MWSIRIVIIWEGPILEDKILEAQILVCVKDGVRRATKDEGFPIWERFTW